MTKIGNNTLKGSPLELAPPTLVYKKEEKFVDVVEDAIDLIILSMSDFEGWKAWWNENSEIAFWSVSHEESGLRFYFKHKKDRGGYKLYRDRGSAKLFNSRELDLLQPSVEELARNLFKIKWVEMFERDMATHKRRHKIE
jgi:hypothetical protein